MKYKIEGSPMPVVVCELSAGEQVVTERGAMSWMSPNMKMQTQAGGVGKAFGRMFSGESMFQNMYTCEGGPGMIAFASSFPGNIHAVPITPEHGLVVQKGGFLASEVGVEMSVFFQKKMGAGFFGGEGFVMQKLSGNGMAFLEIDGHTVEYQLAAGESMIIDTGHLAIMDDTCQIEIVTVAGLKNKLLGGEGFFNTVIKGPGKIVLQSMPIVTVAGALRPFMESAK